MPRLSRRVVVLALAAAAPALVVLTGLMAFDVLDVGPMLLGMAATLVLSLVLVLPFAADLGTAVDTLRRLEDGSEGSPPEPRTFLAAELVVAVARLARGMKARASLQAGQAEAQDALFDALPEPLLLLDRQGRVRRTNRAARGLFTASAAGVDLAVLIRDPLLLRAFDRFREGEPVGEIEVTMPAPPEERRFRALLAPLRAPSQDDAMAVLAFQDITEITRIERMRADFVANASHELRTPLAALLGFIETLQGPARDDRDAHQRFLGIMHDQAARMTRLVADLLTLSRIELYEHSRPEGRCELGALLQRVAAGLELAAKTRKMNIVLTIAPDLPIVAGQDDEITQIFQNLIDNALKYGRPGTKVEVAARLAGPDEVPAAMPSRGEPAVAVTVRDHGEGIARENLPRLTERFYRVDAARSRELGGTGLGLAIVKHAVNRHRGALAIDSTLGEGSSFTVFLPVAR